MQVNHLHLHVRDIEQSEAFYARWFGFERHVTHGEILFLRDAGGLDLALAPDPEPAALPPWFHFGFRLPSGDAVRALRAEMLDAEVVMATELFDYEDLVSFRCRDPDGYAIEIYWE